jgi:hypothetical protein
MFSSLLKVTRYLGSVHLAAVPGMIEEHFGFDGSTADDAEQYPRA